jgi:hypothetical protein
VQLVDGDGGGGFGDGVPAVVALQSSSVVSGGPYVISGGRGK